MRYPVTPDGRYFVVRGRRRALQAADAGAERAARARVHRAKIGLGERGPVW